MTLKVWECDCGNRVQAKFIVASDGEFVCSRCGAVLGRVFRPVEDEENIECWDGEMDQCRNLLEKHVGEKGWEW